jgi:hypothetical protein
MLISALKPGDRIAYRDWQLMEYGRKSGIELTGEVVRVVHRNYIGSYGHGFTQFTIIQVMGGKIIYVWGDEIEVIKDEKPREPSNLVFPGSGKPTLNSRNVSIE